MAASRVKHRLAGLLALCAATACQAPGPPGTPAIAGRAPGLDPDSMEALSSRLRADEAKDLHGVLVLIDGRTVYEEYFNGGGPDQLHDIRSAGKSITSLLVGIAIDRGLIRGLEEHVFALLGVEVPADRAAITLEDVLTMRSGLAADDVDPESPGNEDQLDASSDWLAFAASVPLRAPPGRTYLYNSLTAFLAGAAVEQASGVPLQDFATKHLFGPLGIRELAWRRGPRGEGAGQGNLSLRLRDFAAIGQLVLEGGTSAGKRIISERWLAVSLAPHVPIAAVDRYADHYGYLWYRKTYPVAGAAALVHFASGNGGNKIYLVPSRNMTIAIMSRAYGQRHGQPRSEQILRTILDASTPAADRGRRLDAVRSGKLHQAGATAR